MTEYQHVQPTEEALIERIELRRVLHAMEVYEMMKKLGITGLDWRDLFLCGSYTHVWAVIWQNQQNVCAPSEDSDQPGHPPSLIRVFAVRMKKACVLSYPLSAQWRRWCPGWSESSLGAHSFCWFCHGVAHIVHIHAQIGQFFNSITQ